MKKTKQLNGILNKTFGTLFIVVLGILIFVIMGVNIRTIFKEMTLNRKNELILLNQRLEMVKDSGKMVLSSLKDDYNIYSFLAEENVSKTEQGRVGTYFATRVMALENTMEDLDVSYYVTIIGDNGIEYSSQKFGRSYDFEALKESSWFNKCLETGEGIGDITGVTDFGTTGEENQVYVVYENYYDVRNNEYIGTILVCIDEKNMQECYSSIENEDMEIYLFDQENKCFALTDESDRGYEDENIEKLLNGQEDVLWSLKTANVYVKNSLQDQSWTAVEKIAIISLFQSYARMLLVLLVIAVITTVAAICLIRKYSNSVTRPINKFAKSMEKAVGLGEMIELPEHERYTEIEQLYKSFLIMKSSNDNMAYDLLQKESEKKEMELRFLKAQINPHFIYNTLFSIFCAAQVGKNEEACSMITLLIDLLRKSLSVEGENHCLVEEIAYIKNYVKLQQFGYDGNIALEVEVPENLLEKMVMRNILQPIVENAIFHGIEPTYEDGSIWITAEEEGDRIKIHVRDSGTGMTEEQAQKLRENMKKTPENNNHIGVANVNRRIQENYGDEYGLIFETAPGQGTEFIFILPDIG